MNPVWIAAIGAAVVTAVGSVAFAQAAAEPTGEEGEGEGEVAIPPETPKSIFDGWDGSAELGLNGSTGNSELLNFRLGAGAKRTVPDKLETSADIVYKLGKEEGSTTQSEGSLQLRNDWLLGADSPWRVFALGRLEYDQFQDWDWRLSLFGGVGYEFIETDRTLLLGRAGAGVRKDFGGSDDEWVPEALLGLDFGHQINERQKLTATVDLFPSIGDFGQYRVIAKAAWELLVDPETNLSLKLGVEDRYDSDPGDDIKRNDLDYFAVLVWSF